MLSTLAVTGFLVSAVYAIPMTAKDVREEIIGSREYAAKHPLRSACTWGKATTQLVGDGDPHIDVYAQQISTTVTCDQNAGDCQVSSTTGYSYGYSWDIGLDIGDVPLLGDLTGGISFGFSMEESYEVSVSETCTGGEAYESVCVWYLAPHSAVTVVTVGDWNCGVDTQSRTTDPYVMEIPLTGGGINHYYCVDGTCRSPGEGYWTYNVDPSTLGPNSG